MIARRAAAIREHEDTLRAVLADYFRARDRADAVRADAESAIARIRRDAEARIGQVRERAEREVDGFEQQARTAVLRMLELGESRRAVADATGMSPAQVSAAQHVAQPRADVVVAAGDAPTS